MLPLQYKLRAIAYTIYEALVMPINATESNIE